MKIKSSQKGFVLLPYCLVFIAIASMMAASMISRTAQLSQNTQRMLLMKQAQWLAEGSIERALVDFQRAQDPTSVEKGSFSVEIAPVYIGSDPLLESEPNPNDQQRILTAACSYWVMPADADELLPGERVGFLVSGRCDIPYRGSKITRIVSYLCCLTQEGKWISRPVILK